MVLSREGSDTCASGNDDGKSNVRQTKLLSTNSKVCAIGTTVNVGHDKSINFLRRTTTVMIEKTFDVTKPYMWSWLGLIVFVLLVRKFLSDGGFSSSLTWSSILQCFGYLLLVIKLTKINMIFISGRHVNMNVANHMNNIITLSGSSLFLSLLSLLCRLYSNVFYYGYLPVDKSGDWLYQTIEAISAFLIIYLLGSMYYISTNNKPHPKPSLLSLQNLISVIGIKSRLQETVLLFISFILAVFLHPTRNKSALSDTSWAFSLYMESLAMIPQLYLMTSIAASGGETVVEKWIGHYLGSQAASNICCLFFWWRTSKHVVPRYPNSAVGWAVFMSVAIKNLLMADYLYHYLKAVLTGQTITLRRWNSCSV